MLSVKRLIEGFLDEKPRKFVVNLRVNRRDETWIKIWKFPLILGNPRGIYD